MKKRILSIIVLMLLLNFTLFIGDQNYIYANEGVHTNTDCTCQQILDTKYKKIVSYIVRLYTPYATLDIAPRNAGQIIPTV